MIIDEKTAWKHGFDDYGYNDMCPYIYDDLKHSWFAGWMSGMMAVAGYAMIKRN